MMTRQTDVRVFKLKACNSKKNSWFVYSVVGIMPMCLGSGLVNTTSGCHGASISNITR